jgi:hypothetical protein
MGCGAGAEKVKVKNFFSEEKKQRLSSPGPCQSGKIRDSLMKVFWFFFSKKNLLPFPLR